MLRKVKFLILFFITKFLLFVIKIFVLFDKKGKPTGNANFNNAEISVLKNYKV